MILSGQVNDHDFIGLGHLLLLEKITLKFSPCRGCSHTVHVVCLNVVGLALNLRVELQ